LTDIARSGRDLLIGAAGQTGAQLSSIIGPDRVLPASRKAAGAGWLTLDLASLATQAPGTLPAFANLGLESIYCVGGMTDVERCETEPDLAMAVNCLGPAQLAAIASDLAIPFVYFSTEYVFDGHSGPYREDDAPHPISVYGRSKWNGEQAVLDRYPRALIIRTTVVYGPDPAGKNFLYSLLRALREGRPFRVPSDQISTPTYNRDLARATVALVASGATGVFHVAGSEVVSRLQFALRAVECRAAHLEAERNPSPTSHAPHRRGGPGMGSP
jgi:dTDP-4-dehydrorhamnose reductase